MTKVRLTELARASILIPYVDQVLQSVINVMQAFANSYKGRAATYDLAMASENHKQTVNIRTITAIKGKVVSILKRSPEPAIALSAVFEALGYTGVTGIGWGILAGFVVSVAIELGYDVREMGGRYILFKKTGAKA